MNEQKNEPAQNSKNTWVVTILVAIIVALLVGGGIYFWQNSKNKTLIEKLSNCNDDGVISGLESEIKSEDIVSESKYSCETDNDCVSTNCCFPSEGTEAVNKKYALKCQTKCPKRMPKPPFYKPVCQNNQCVMTATDENETKVLLQIYENKQYGFKLKYPKDWTVSNRNVETYGGMLNLAFRSPNNQKLAKQALNTKKGNADFFGNDMEIAIFNKNPFRVNDPVDKKIGETTINNKKAVEYWIGGYGSYYGLVVENDGLFFKFGFKNCKTEECIKNRLLSNELDQILNSFEFTN